MTGGLLAPLSAEDRRRVLATARRHRYARREVLFHEGDPADSFHLIDTGRVAVRVLSKHPELTPFQVKTVLHALCGNAAP